MKRLSLEGVYEYGVLGVLLLIVIHAPISVGLGVMLPQYAEIIKAWKEILMALLSCIAILLIWRHHLWHRMVQSKVITVAAVFILLHILVALVSFHDASVTVAGLMIDL